MIAPKRRGPPPIRAPWAQPACDSRPISRIAALPVQKSPEPVLPPWEVKNAMLGEFDAATWMHEVGTPAWLYISIAVCG
jgi:hypothetical protein